MPSASSSPPPAAVSRSHERGRATARSRKENRIEVHVSINTNGSQKELQRLTDRLGDLANLLEAITEAELSRSSNSYFAAGLDFVSKEINAVYAQIYDLVNGWEVTK